MSYVETIPFNYSSKEYVLLVRALRSESCTDFHVTAITDDLQSKIYMTYVFRWNGNELTLQPNRIDNEANEDLVHALSSTIYNQVVLKNGSERP